MGKKKGKKKSSSKSKKSTSSTATTGSGTNAVETESTTEVASTSSDNLVSPDLQNIVEDVGDSNEILPAATDSSVVGEGQLAENDMPTNPRKAEPAKTIQPKSDSAGLDESNKEASREISVSSKDNMGDIEAEKIVAADFSPDTTHQSDSPILEGQLPEKNDEATNERTESDEEPLFLDARSCESDDSNGSENPLPVVELVDETASETTPTEVANTETTKLDEQQTEVTAEIHSPKNDGVQRTESSDLNDKHHITITPESQTKGKQSEAITEPRVEVTKLYSPRIGGNISPAISDEIGSDQDGDSCSDNETALTYVNDLPLFHYSRIVGSGLPSGIQSGGEDNLTQQQCFKCSEFAIVRVDREELVSSMSNIQPSQTVMLSPELGVPPTLSSANEENLASAEREQTLLLSSDLWFQPHSILACGYGKGRITFTRLSKSGGNKASPSVVFATPSSELGVSGIIDSGQKYSSVSTTLQLQESEASVGHSIIDLSFDASGSVLGAVDEGGHCTVWELKYTTSLQSSSLVFGDPSEGNRDVNSDINGANSEFYTPASTPIRTRPPVSPVSSAAPQTSNYFSNFMSVLTGIPPADENTGGNNSSHGGTNIMNDSAHGTRTSATSNHSNSSNAAATPPETLLPALTAEISNQSRINYPAKWGHPTCLAIDPAYKSKRDKSIIVGFASGQLYLTRKGTFFQRRNDTILYQAPHHSDSSYRGIETIAWRGPLVAWADATGIKLMDSDHLTRIAHIDRPAGASPFLYPSIQDLSPSLFFETSQFLLVGWGDCLMQICVEEEDDTSSALSVPQSRNSSGGSSSSEGEKRKKRSATCTMAWELDCVACDIVPLDGDHVVILGLVELENGEYIIDRNGGETTSIDGCPSHDLEMQILSREDGTISYSDALPLIEKKDDDASEANSPPIISARNFRLLSSFALPRMEDAEETKVLKALKGANDMGFVGIDVSFDMNQPLFAGTDSFAKNGIEFKDPHLEWNIQSIMYDSEGDDDDTGLFGASNTDDSSVDSDDYECILRPIETIRPLTSPPSRKPEQNLLPPTMVVCTKTEAVLSVTSTVDDAIEYSLDNRKCAQALFRGLRHKRQLRRYSLGDLINYYLEAVLRIPKAPIEQDDAVTTTLSTRQESSSLSLRRMQLAVKAMPVLLGDRIELWERWTKELENIPGSLFILRKYLPVRDPILPSTIYVRILEKLLEEVGHLSQTLNRDKPSSIEIYAQASKHFLESLVAWGPTKVLKEYISFYNYNKMRREGDKDAVDDVRATEISLQRRYLQTAAGYLIFPVRDIEDELTVSAPKYEVLNVDTEDSLFDISEAVALIAPRVPIVASPNDFGESGSQNSKTPFAFAPNNHICLDAMARLRMMEGEFDLALKCFLAIGACHATDPIESFEETAIQIVNHSEVTIETSPNLIGNHSYEFVMSMIERHELNQFLFEKDFLLSTDSKLFLPIFALIRLVGLRGVGNFLMDHCVAAGFSYNTTLRAMNAFSFSEDDSGDEPGGILRRGSLPIDKVAEQLENSPQILHWYLHLVFTKRPDFYVNFPTNSIPSKAVKRLHRQHFQLYVDFAGDMKDSSKVLAGIEAYKVESKTTPLLTFLKAALPLSGLLPVDARRVLEIERSKDTERDDGDKADSRESSSPIFALELAYIIEKYSDETEAEAMGILNLYLKGAKSLTLAVSYAQRQKTFSSMLWDHLISYCLKEASDGTIYGELLEAAALKGADLARLVERIPPGMVVEGLRPRLVAAVADYRMKLEIYEAAIAAGSEEQVTLMREIGHRARRGLRFDTKKNRKTSFAELIAEKSRKDEQYLKNTTIGDEPNVPPQIHSKTKLRRGHKRLLYSIPRR